MAGSRRHWFVNEHPGPSFSVIGSYWGIPASWQGWTVLAVYVAVVAALVATLMPERWPLALAGAALATAAFVAISVAKGRRIDGIGP